MSVTLVVVVLAMLAAGVVLVSALIFGVATTPRSRPRGDRGWGATRHGGGDGGGWSSDGGGYGGSDGGGGDC